MAKTRKTRYVAALSLLVDKRLNLTLNSLVSSLRSMHGISDITLYHDCPCISFSSVLSYEGVRQVYFRDFTAQSVICHSADLADNVDVLFDEGKEADHGERSYSGGGILFYLYPNLKNYFSRQVQKPDLQSKKDDKL